MPDTINCRRCGKAYPPTEFNAPARPSCQACLAERRANRAQRRLTEPPKPKKVKPGGRTYEGRQVVLTQLGFASYRDYLASPLWVKIRSKVLRDKGGKCFICAGPATQVHHNKYTLAVMRGRSLSGLAPLCADCHRGVEFNGGKKIKAMKTVCRKYQRQRTHFLDTSEEQKVARMQAWAAHRGLDSKFAAMFRPFPAD